MNRHTPTTDSPRTSRIPAAYRTVAMLLAVVLGAAGCVAYPAGPYGYRGGGWRAAPPAYAYAAPRPHWRGGWGYQRW